MADFSQLSRLTRKADSVAESASVLVRQTLREIRGELANLSTELNLAGNADDREKVYTEIRRRMALLSRRMNALMQAQVEEAAKGAAKSASALTGLEVKYSPSRAKAICELVTPAQGENLAAVFTDRMGRNLINSLREATVGMLREQAVAGGSTKDMARDLAARWAKAANVEDPKFTDVSGRVWDTRTYIQMNVRTNTMRVYNDCLADNVARETGSDLMRISTGGDQDCDCAAWEGCIISLTGATKGLPTYEDARNGGCFHPNCTHTLEYVDEVVDAAEIELQKSVPADEDMADDYDAQDERKYQIDQARYMRDNPGMTQEQARVAVDRDNLAASIQSGLIREDAREVVAKMTDAQVTALCPNGNPPAFEPAKRIPGGTRAEPKYEPEKWNHGSNGGVVHIARDASAEQILEVCKVKDAKPPEQPAPKPEPEKEEPPKEDAEIVAAREKLHGLFSDPAAGSRIAGFSDEDRAVFDNIPPEMLKAYAGAITLIARSSGTSKCCGSVLYMGTSEWSNNRHTYYHEAGHAVLESANSHADYFFGTKLRAKGDLLLKAIKKDAEALFDRLCGKMLTRDVWNSKTRQFDKKPTKSRDWSSLQSSMLVKDILNVDTDFMRLSVSDKKTVGAVMDSLQAATRSKYTGHVGHSVSYYNDASMRIHEPVANISALIASGKVEIALKTFPEATRIIARDFYGMTFDKTPTKEVK